MTIAPHKAEPQARESYSSEQIRAGGDAVSSTDSKRPLLPCLILSMLGIPLLSYPAVGQDLLGANAVMQQVRKEAQQDSAAENVSVIAQAVDVLEQKIATLEASEAAGAWLELYDKWIQHKQQPVRDGQHLKASKLMNVLPPPEAWPTLMKLIEARPVDGDEKSQMRAIGLRMLAHRLNGQMELQKADIEQALALVQPKPIKTQNKGDLNSIVGNLFADTAENDYWKQNQLQRVRTIKSAIDPAAGIEQFKSDLAEIESGGYLSVPRLVRTVGREEATELLLKALQLKNVILYFDGGETDENETVKLARELAVEHIDEISSPHWSLCNSIDATELFEAFTAMPVEDIGAYGGEQSNNQAAAMYYVMGLIVRNRTEEVLKFMTKSASAEKGGSSYRFGLQLNYQILPELERAGHTSKVYTFLAEALTTNPELPLWEPLVELAAGLNKSAEVLTLVETSLAKKELSKPLRGRLEKIRATALLATDQVEEAVALLLKILADRDAETAANQGASGKSNLEIAIQVAEVGRLMERQDWIRQGTDIAEELVESESNTQFPGTFRGLLLDLKQFSRAERLVTESLVREVASSSNQPSFGFPTWSGDAQALNHLVRVYHAAERYDDVITLLEEAPWWNRSDISEWLELRRSSRAAHGARTDVPIPYIAARALAESGRKPEAQRIAQAMVRQSPGFDPGWALALELTGDEFAPLAEEIFAQDQFEERPLIWLARYYLERGDTAKAETLTRRAIAIDPSDGEQRRGDRMRVYAILAEILKANGDGVKAATYEGAVTAIRLAEQADQFYHAGMLQRGIGMYRTSLSHFADAYCVQSRLAVQLAAVGDLEGAANPLPTRL